MSVRLHTYVYKGVLIKKEHLNTEVLEMIDELQKLDVGYLDIMSDSDIVVGKCLYLHIDGLHDEELSKAFKLNIDIETTIPQILLDLSEEGINIYAFTEYG